jgi:PucR C-terminal helix-turn-helix domain
VRVRSGEVLEPPAERAVPRPPASPGVRPRPDPAASPDRPYSGAGQASYASPPSGTSAVGVASAADGDNRGEPSLHELLLASVPAAVFGSSAERLLRPLRDYDARHNAELMPTLRSFLACDGSWAACASLMYVHVNTVRYRISRIEALTGRGLSLLADRVDFFLALRGA